MKTLLLILLISTIAIAQDRPRAKLIYDINYLTDYEFVHKYILNHFLLTHNRVENA
jgi:hypothetical protein